MYYWAIADSEMLKKGNDYSKLRKTICILITAFDAKKLPNLNEVTKLHSKYKILNVENPKVQLTDVFEMLMSDAIKKAKEKIDGMSKAEMERELAFKRERTILDLNTLMNEGLRKGKEEANIETVKVLLKNNVDVKIIIESTGLSKEEIDELKSKFELNDLISEF